MGTSELQRTGNAKKFYYYENPGEGDEAVEQLLEDDELSEQEAGFMIGYSEAGEKGYEREALSRSARLRRR